MFSKPAVIPQFPVTNSDLVRFIVQVYSYIKKWDSKRDIFEHGLFHILSQNKYNYKLTVYFFFFYQCQVTFQAGSSSVCTGSADLRPAGASRSHSDWDLLAVVWPAGRTFPHQSGSG